MKNKTLDSGPSIFHQFSLYSLTLFKCVSCLPNYLKLAVKLLNARFLVSKPIYFDILLLFIVFIWFRNSFFLHFSALKRSFMFNWPFGVFKILLKRNEKYWTTKLFVDYLIRLLLPFRFRWNDFSVKCWFVMLSSGERSKNFIWNWNIFVENQIHLKTNWKIIENQNHTQTQWKQLEFEVDKIYRFELKFLLNLENWISFWWF